MMVLQIVDGQRVEALEGDALGDPAAQSVRFQNIEGINTEVIEYLIVSANLAVRQPEDMPSVSATE